MKRSQPPVLPAWPVVNDLLTLPLAQRLELVQTLWDSIAADQGKPEFSDADVVRQKHPGIEVAWIQRVIANAFFDRGFLKVRTRSQPSAPALPPSGSSAAAAAARPAGRGALAQGAGGSSLASWAATALRSPAASRSSIGQSRGQAA